MFKRIDDLINILETPVSVATDGVAKIRYGLQVAGDNMDNVLNHILGVRAATGARLQESTRSMWKARRGVNYAEQVSGIQDVDYVKAVSDLTRQQTILQASQQSVAKVSGLSLFNFL